MARETKHTPGTWHLVYRDGYGYIYNSPEVDGDDLLNADEVGDETADANLKLVAHAPEMLEALKKAKRVIRSLKLSMQAHPDNEPGSEFDDFTNTAEHMEDEIEELITKATTI